MTARMRAGRGRRPILGSTVEIDEMDLEQAIRTRRTHKAYRPEPVGRETLDELFELARWAPNHHLTNPWRFRVLGPRALERLKRAADAVGPGSGRSATPAQPPRHAGRGTVPSRASPGGRRVPSLPRAA